MKESSSSSSSSSSSLRKSKGRKKRRAYTPAESKKYLALANTQYNMLKTMLWRRLYYHEYTGAARVLTLLLQFYNWDFDSITKGCVEIINHLAPQESIIRFHRRFIQIAAKHNKHMPELVMEVAYLFYLENDIQLAFDHLTSHMTQPYRKSSFCFGYGGIFAFLLAKQALQNFKYNNNNNFNSISYEQTIKKIQSYASKCLSFLDKALTKSPSCDAFLLYRLKALVELDDNNIGNSNGENQNENDIFLSKPILRQMSKEIVRFIEVT